MVVLDVVRLSSSAARLFKKRRFVDSLRMHVIGGTGGNGYPKYGGIGGKGGDVYVKAQEEFTLRFITQHNPEQRAKAGVGGESQRYRILGEPGKDYTIICPTGVNVLSEQGRVLGNLDKSGDHVLVARGGRGGCEENQFSGQKGQAHTVILDLKLIADVGLIGFPNAGKSSLLTALSRASPKIASYPFTTLSPHIGIIKFDDLRTISVADLPGLIEGAHINVGLGHRFLKHIERTKVLLFVIDIEGFQLSHKTKYRSALETIVLLNKELELYSERLLDKPAILAVNKMDLKDFSLQYGKLIEDVKNIQDVTSSWPSEYLPTKFIHFDEILSISAKTGEAVGQLTQRLRELTDFYNEEKRRDDSDKIPNLDILLGRNTDEDRKLL